VRHQGLQPDRVGTKQPLRTEDSEEGRQLNRSVTFKVSFAPASSATAGSSNGSPATPPGH
jgi:hypothetical protein